MSSQDCGLNEGDRNGQNGQKWAEWIFPKIQNKNVTKNYGTKAYFPKLSWPT